MALDNQKQPVDRWLNAAIKEYGSVEPDAGLEQRVLRNLQARSARSIAWGKWWVLAATAAIVLIMASVALKKSADEPKKEAVVPPTQMTIANAPQIPRPPQVGISINSGKSHAGLGVKSKKHWPAEFPTPYPLSDEEKMFASYAERFPKEATLTQQENVKFDDEVRQAELAAENSARSN